MEILYTINLFLHLLAAVIWIGGSIFIGMVAPKLSAQDPEQSRKILRFMGLQFRNTSWIAVGVLLLTGLGNVSHEGGFTDYAKFLSDHPAFPWKLSAVFAMIVIKYAHDFIAGPYASAFENPNHRKWRRIATVLARLNVALGIIVLYLAVVLQNPHG